MQRTLFYLSIHGEISPLRIPNWYISKMKKIILLPTLILLISSCWIKSEEQEILPFWTYILKTDTWRSGDIKIHKKWEKDYYFSTMLVKWPPSYNQWIRNWEILINDNIWIHNKDGCNISFTFEEKHITVTSKNYSEGCQFWNWVYIDWTYIKTNNTNPEYFENQLWEKIPFWTE